MPLGPWMMAIARNKMIDDLRRRGRRPGSSGRSDAIRIRRRGPAGPIDANDVTRVLNRLPERNREIVQAISIDGHSARDVAARLGMTEIAVRVALHRSLKSLADTYQEKKSMKTDDLIKALAADATSVEPPIARTLAVAVAAGPCCRLAFFLWAFGVRADFSNVAMNSGRFVFKFVLTLSVAIPAFLLVRESGAAGLSRPARGCGGWRWLRHCC